MNLIWNAHFVGSGLRTPSIASQIPHWAVPGALSHGIVHRELWHPDWWRPIVLLVVTDLCGRLSYLGLGYALFSNNERRRKAALPLCSSCRFRRDRSQRSRIGKLAMGHFFDGNRHRSAVWRRVCRHSGSNRHLLWTPSFELLPIPVCGLYDQCSEPLLPAAVIGVQLLVLAMCSWGFVLPYEIVLGSMVASLFAMVFMNPHPASLQDAAELRSGLRRTDDKADRRHGFLAIRRHWNQHGDRVHRHSARVQGFQGTLGD